MEIKSIGRPPEQYANWMVARMLRQVAQEHAHLWDTITAIAKASSTGSPKAQEKLAHRINKTNAFGLHLQPGKRGQFELRFFSLTGWNPDNNSEIEPGDPIPAKPWLLVHVCRLESKGRGLDEVSIYSSKFVLVTHHVLSRAAQRFESRTIEHLVDMARTITVATMDICIEKGGAKPALEQCPASGYRVKLDELDMTVVLTKHRSQSAFVAVTMYPTGEAA